MLCRSLLLAQDLRGRFNTTSFSPAAAWKRGSVEALKRSNPPLLERSDRSPALKNRSAEGENSRRMNHHVRPVAVNHSGVSEMSQGLSDDQSHIVPPTNRPGLTRSFEHNVFFACGSVEKRLFSPQIFAKGENLG